jgi:Domain of unknown function (DUF4159)
MMTRRRLTLIGLLCTLAITASVSLAQQFRQSGRPSQSVQLPADRAGVQDWKVDEAFKKDVFTFVRIEYDSDRAFGRGGFGGAGFGGGGFGGGGRRAGGRRGGGYGRGGWLTDWPDSDLNFSFRLQQLTSLKVNPEPINMRLTDDQLFDYPFIYIIEPGWLSFSPEEGARLRQYLLNGGFLMVDDFWGQEALDNFLGQMKQRVFNQDDDGDTYDAKELPFEHEIFRCVYRLKEKPQVPSIHNWQWSGQTWEDHGENSQQVHYMGIEDKNGRLMAIICHNTDLGDGWEREGENEEYFREFSEKKSYPMGINIVTYAMTR